MKRARKSNRVSWAPGVNLCQVKLFLSDDCPSKVGQKSQDHLQAKTSSVLHSSTNEYNDLPPGFEGNHFLNQSKDELPCLSQINWKCPPPFVLSYHWRVAAGEESREKDAQKLREMKVLEAVYPRLSAIPPSPSVPLDVEEEDYDDRLTPLVPIIPIEEEESMEIKPEFSVAANTSTNVQSQNLRQHISTSIPISLQSNTSPPVPLPAGGKPLAGLSQGLEADLAAASAVVAAIMKSNEQGSLIDMDLLVKIFNDPVMVEKLINEHKTVATTVSAPNSVAIPPSGLKPAIPSVPLSSNSVTIPTSGLKPAIPIVPLSSTTPNEASFGTSTSTMGLLPCSGLKQATVSVSSLKPAHDKPALVSVPATPSVSVLMSTPEKPATISVPLSRPMPGKPATPSVPMPASTPAPHMHLPVSKNIHQMSNGVRPAINTQPHHQDAVLVSGVKRAASMASISSSEFSKAPLSLPSGNLHAVANQVQSTVNTVPYQPNTGSAFAVKEAYPVKDANYYKNLIKQHGAVKQDVQDSQQIGIRHNNFQDLKLVHNNNPGDVKFKIQKPCIYFKSPRGCRNGSNCPYQHDTSVQWGAGNVLGAQNAKRLKLGPEV